MTWSGNCREGKATGQGTLVWRYFENGSWKEDCYDGDMRHDKMHGDGTIALADGSRYVGALRDYKPDGQDTFTTGTVVLTGRWTKGCFQHGNRKAWVGTNEEACGFR